MEKKFEFKPFDKVLVREDCLSKTKGGLWRFAFFIRYSDNGDYVAKELDTWFSKETLSYSSCIPYEGNEHLADTTDSYKPPYEPKRGDFVIVEGGEDKHQYIAIFDCIDNDIIKDYASYDCDYKMTSCESRYFILGSKIIRKAYEDEKQFLFDKMHEQGKDWNARKCEVVDYKWKPEVGEIYFAPDITGGDIVPRQAVWHDIISDNKYYNKGWAFKRAEKCQVLCDKLNEIRM